MQYQKKAEESSYDKFQKSKEEGMAIMASNRDATLIVCEIIKKWNPGEPMYIDTLNKQIQNEIKKWRKWFYVEIYSTTPYEQMVQEAKNMPGAVPFK